MAQSFMVIAGHYEDAARLLEDGKVGGSADALERAFGAVKDTADWMGSSGTLSLDPSVRETFLPQCVARWRVLKLLCPSAQEDWILGV